MEPGNIVDYIMSTIDHNIITIYHCIVGSKTYPEQFIDPNPKYKRNHELPQLVKNFLLNPQMQLSPDFIAKISHIDQITIRQMLILIDPLYENDHKLIGFINDHPRADVFEHEIIHNEFKKTKIVSKLETIIIPSNVNQDLIISIANLIEHFGKIMPMVINIMDCTSITLNKFYETNTSSSIFLPKPNCFLIDGDIVNLPILTLADKTINTNSCFPVRWVNYDDDIGKMDDLYTISEFCQYSNNTRLFLEKLYLLHYIGTMLFAIWKLLGLTSVTLDYSLVIDTTKTITFKYSEMRIIDFITYWRYPKFVNMITSIDSHHKKKIITFINLIIDCNIDIPMQTILLQDFLKSKAIDILHKISKYIEIKELNLYADPVTITRLQLYDIINTNGFDVL